MRGDALPFVAAAVAAAIILTCAIFFSPKKEPEVQQQQPLRVLSSNEESAWFRGMEGNQSANYCRYHEGHRLNWKKDAAIWTTNTIFGVDLGFADDGTVCWRATRK